MEICLKQPSKVLFIQHYFDQTLCSVTIETHQIVESFSKSVSRLVQA